MFTTSRKPLPSGSCSVNPFSQPMPKSLPPFPSESTCLTRSRWLTRSCFPLRSLPSQRWGDKMIKPQSHGQKARQRVLIRRNGKSNPLTFTNKIPQTTRTRPPSPAKRQPRRTSGLRSGLRPRPRLRQPRRAPTASRPRTAPATSLPAAGSTASSTWSRRSSRTAPPSTSTLSSTHHRRTSGSARPTRTISSAT